ncbi:glycosyltransferase [Chloroflexota bacterium]
MRDTNAELMGNNFLNESEETSIIYVSTFPPRICGIATFTQDLTSAMDAILAPVVTSKITAMNPGSGVVRYRYPRKVILQINEYNLEDYVSAAKIINKLEQVKIVSIQHEFGIFGGQRGLNIIPFMQAVDKPVVVTLHTVLPDPDEMLCSTVNSLADNSSALIVMTDSSKKILSQDYSIIQDKIKVVPHGIHPQPYNLSRTAKMALGYSDRVVLSSFGLLGRSKGLEYVIEALPQVVRKYPDFVYIIVGATHPGVLAQEGESYRISLIDKIHDLGLYEHVRMYNRYFPLTELLHFLKATDIYISPSLDPNQAVSGTLSYALGMGRPVISTAFSQASELITDNIGILVDFRNPDSYAEAILQLLEDSERRLQMGKNAYFLTRNMTWPNVALQYIKIFAEYAPELEKISQQKSLPMIRFTHLERLTDSFGIVQFANLNRRDISSGYTLDDNARALSATVLYYEKLKKSARGISSEKEKIKLLDLIIIYLEFISFTARDDGHFQNYVNHNREIDNKLNGQVNSNESNARAIYALALAAATTSLPKSVRLRALNLLKARLQAGIQFDSPRALAHCIKSFYVLKSRKVQIDEIANDEMLVNQCNRLVELYQSTKNADWHWFENILAYSNGVMPEALLLAYHITRNEEYLSVGKKTLDFLVKESFIDGIFMPIGQKGWRKRGGIRNHFDQQPEETMSVILALKAGYSATGNDEYRLLMRKVFNWFLGDNTLKQIVYDRTTGGCFDGISKEEINLNQGAESSISYLLARIALE